MSETESKTGTVKVLVFSDDVDTRKAVIEGTGLRPAADLPEIEWTEVATAEMAKEYILGGNYAVVILDGETPKISGMIVAKDLYQVMDQVPRIIILTGRPQDDWLASFSGAHAVVAHPLNPIDLQEAVEAMLRSALHGVD